MTSPTTSPTQPSDGATVQSTRADEAPATGKYDALLLSFLVLGALSSIGYLMWFASRVPVSAEDIKESSWGAGMWNLTGFMSVQATVMGYTCLVTGVLIGVAKRSLPAVLTGVFVAATLHFGASETAQFRFNAAMGTAKIGCYVWDSKECRGMLGVPAGIAPSMYLPAAEQARNGKVFTNWYENKLESLEFPGGFHSTVRNLFSPDALNAALTEQRNAVTRFRKSGGISH